MRGKHFEKFCWTKKRIISAILSAVLLFTGIGFSTYAWLTATDTPEVNEFTGSKLVIQLTPDEDQGAFKLVPGKLYELEDNQAPKITIEKESVECYLFVVFHEVGTLVNGNRKHLDEFVSYNYNAGQNWGMLKQLVADGTDENGMPYRDYIFYAKTPQHETDLCNYVHQNNEIDQVFDIMAKNGNGKAYFQISDQLTKQEVAPTALAGNPYITFTAYSIQTLGFKGKTTTGTDEEKALGDMNLAWAAVEEAIANGNTKSVVLN